MDAKIKYSILVPAYNVGNYINECIQSVLESIKDYAAAEIVIIDDGSTDKTKDVCLEIASKDPRIRFKQQENKGLILTRRNLLRIANGEYIIFLDSDDKWSKNFFPTIDSTIDLYKPDVIMFSYSRFNENGSLLPIKKPLYDVSQMFDMHMKTEIILKIVSTHHDNNIWSKVIKKEIIDVETDYEPYKNIQMGEDLLQLMPVLCNAKNIYFLTDALYEYRQNLHSMTYSYKPDYLQNFRDVRWNVYRSLKTLNLSDKDLSAFFLHYINSILFYLLQSSYYIKNNKVRLELYSEFKSDKLLSIAQDAIKPVMLSKRLRILLMITKKQYIYNLAILKVLFGVKTIYLRLRKSKK
ncbi:glycosyltransferase family 2 protein [Paenibacillus sp. MMO-58]|uniref:glycosyltransferase family 2 protein n=1 Tax=Paenibacillus sp. MMO-58 TaxID=3081290 RepID=UPI003016A8AD